VSQKMLAQTLQNLEADGFVTRTVHPTVPPQVEYGLTPIGLEAATRVQQLAVWIEDITPKVLQVRAKRVRTPS
jgi:DNA-binding HxlR family transcriptional regulator